MTIINSIQNILLEDLDNDRDSVEQLKKYVGLLLQIQAFPHEKLEIKKDVKRSEQPYMIAWKETKENNGDKLEKAMASIFKLPTSSIDLLHKSGIKLYNLINANWHLSKDESKLEVILNYSQSAFRRLASLSGKDHTKISSKEIWGEPLHAARGIIFGVNLDDAIQNGKNATIVLIAKSLTKFFNFSEYLETSEKEIKKLLTGKGVTYSVRPKIDGYLGIIYYNVDNKIAISTRGSFNSSGVEVGNSILGAFKSKTPKEKMDSLKQHLRDGMVLAVEIIAPETKIHINYGDKRDIVLIGAVKIDRYKGNIDYELSDEQLDVLAKRFSLRRPSDFDKEARDKLSGWNDFEKLLAKVSSMKETDKEGYVIQVYDNNGMPYMRLKLKYKAYIKQMKQGKVNIPATIRAIEGGREVEYVAELDFEALDAFKLYAKKSKEHDSEAQTQKQNIYREVAANFTSIINTLFDNLGEPNPTHFEETLTTLYEKTKIEVVDNDSSIEKEKKTSLRHASMSGVSILPGSWRPSMVWYKITKTRIRNAQNGKVSPEIIKKNIVAYIKSLPIEIRKFVIANQQESGR